MAGKRGKKRRELHELVKKGHARDPLPGRQYNKLAQPQNRWQRAVRYIWDKNRGRG
jgi:hypothetical protein